MQGALRRGHSNNRVELWNLGYYLCHHHHCLATRTIYAQSATKQANHSDNFFNAIRFWLEKLHFIFRNKIVAK